MPLARGFLTQLREFLIARAAGAEVIQPLVDLWESQLAESDASEDRRARTANALWVRELARQAPR